MRNGRPYAIKIAPAAVIAFAALAVGYGLGEQAQDGGLQKAAGRFDHGRRTVRRTRRSLRQGKQAVFDAMNHFDELAIVERANPYRKDGR